MQFQRTSPTELLVVGPLEAVREAVWHALREARVQNPIIDVEKNAVAGSTGDGILTVARTVTAQLTPLAEGISVMFASKAVLGGTIDLGAGKKAARKLADALERVLSSGFSPSGVVGPTPSSDVYAAPPIALATGGTAPFVATGGPLYGNLVAPKRGTTLLVYGLLGLLCCQILTPFTIVYSISALRDYKAKGDPGDKGLVIAALVLGILGVIALVLRIVIGVAGMGR